MIRSLVVLGMIACLSLASGCGSDETSIEESPPPDPAQVQQMIEQSRQQYEESGMFRGQAPEAPTYEGAPLPGQEQPEQQGAETQ